MEINEGNQDAGLNGTRTEENQDAGLKGIKTGGNIKK